MPKTKLQQLFFAVLTVAMTVPLFVFYNLSLEMGGMSNQIFIQSLNVIPVIFVCAILVEIFIAGPLAHKLAFSMIDPQKDSPLTVTLAIICSTIFFMCPLMSLFSTLLFHGFTAELVAQWMQAITINLPFAVFSQIFFVQPLVRFVFRVVFKSQLDESAQEFNDESIELEEHQTLNEAIELS